MSNSEEKQIANLKKQNDGMETAFKNKGIKFTKLSIDNVDPETELLLLKDYNNYLKGISAANRPPAPVKEEKPKVEAVKPKVVKEDDDSEDEVKEVKPVFSTITNMEDIKRAFFSKDYETFNTLVKQQPFGFYESWYKYSNDNNGKPAFVAKNLLRGFVQNLDDYRKYLMVCFRCTCESNSNEPTHYDYPAYWIVNSNDDLKTIIGSIYDDFEFFDITNQEESTYDYQESLNIMLRKMQKTENEDDTTLIGEAYLH